MMEDMSDIFSVNDTASKENIVSIDDMLEKDSSIQKTTKVKRKKDKILLVQVSLLVIWVILTTLVYFFGYNLFEPFIKV